MSKEIKNYDNGEVVIISSKPSSERRNHTKRYMERVEKSSQAVFQTLKEIEETYYKEPRNRTY
ncbi:hypothetical protein AAAC51_07435 [Priestia megaterium]